MTSIELTNVVKRFAGVTALRDVNLKVEEGEFVAFLGPSGCGKTTTLRLIAGFESPTAGDVSLGGRSMASVPPERRDVGMVFQNYALFPHLTVRENVEFGLEMRKVGKSERWRRVDEILERLQIASLGGRRPGEISGGQQQRTALARALVLSPAVLLLDEPLANLDRKLRDEMQIYIRDLQQDFGITTVHVTHDQPEALTMAQRIVVMSEGLIAQVATPEDVYWRPATSHVARFMGQANIVEGVIQSIDGLACSMTSPLGTIVASHSGTARVGQEVLAVIRPEQITISFDHVPVEGGSPPHPGTVPSKVTSQAFHGSTVHRNVLTESGVELSVTSLASDVPISTDRCTISVDDRAAWIIPVSEIRS